MSTMRFKCAFHRYFIKAAVNQHWKLLYPRWHSTHNSTSVIRWPLLQRDAQSSRMLRLSSSVEIAVGVKVWLHFPSHTSDSLCQSYPVRIEGDRRDLYLVGVSTTLLDDSDASRHIIYWHHTFLAQPGPRYLTPLDLAFCFPCCIGSSRNQWRRVSYQGNVLEEIVHPYQDGDVGAEVMLWSADSTRTDK